MRIYSVYQTHGLLTIMQTTTSALEIGSRQGMRSRATIDQAGRNAHGGIQLDDQAASDDSNSSSEDEEQQRAKKKQKKKTTNREHPDLQRRRRSRG